MFVCAATVVWMFDEKEIHDYILITEVQSYADAMEKIEKTYGDDIIKVELTIVNDENFIYLSEDAFKSYLEGEMSP